MGIASAGYSITMRLYHSPDNETAVGRITTAVGEAGGVVSAIDFVDSEGDRATIDVTANARDVAHADEISAAVDLIDGVSVHKVSDRTFLIHLGGKLEVRSKVQLRTRDQLSMAYTPGVARVSRAIADRPGDAHNLTIKGNSVAIVTDGSAVLGLGNIGPAAAMPVMEGKAALFKRFADVDAWPICLDSQDADEIVRTVELISPGFGGVNLEDIAAPRCFEIEERLTKSLNIPVFHDDQHGTAIVVLAALTNAMRLVGKRFEDATVAMAGAGAAGVAVAKLLMQEKIGCIISADSKGIIHSGRDLVDPSKQWLAQHTNTAGRSGELVESLDGADIFIGVSAANIFAPPELARMNRDPIVFALANPDPEVDARGAREYAAVVATGRSDYPNQINNVLAFPGVFRGALDARAPKITQDMNVAAARAIASVVTDDQLSPTYVIPSIFNERVTAEVAAAVRAAADV